MGAHFTAGLNALMFGLIVIISIFLAYALKRRKVTFFPESVAAMLFGCAIGGVVLLIDDQRHTHESDHVHFSPEIFFYLILPPIIFDAGYTMKKGMFFKNLISISLFAVVGTVISCLVIGYILFLFARIGVVPLDSEDPIECLMFGALISATDPVATLSIMGSVGADPTLYSLVFGESVLNDAVSIVLFNTFKDHYGKEFTRVTVFEIIGEFVGISVGSIVMGSVIALLSAFIFKNTMLREFPAYEFSLLFFFAYCSYALGEVLGISGIMALFFCGILMAHYTWYNLSKVARETTVQAFHSFALVAETFLFAYMGITAVISFNPSYNLKWSVGMIGISLAACLLARFLNVFPLSVVANLRRKKKITPRMMLFLWFAGLRGAIAFALSLDVDTPGGPYIVTTTMTIVLLTTCVCGVFTEPILKALDLKEEQKPAPVSMETPLLQHGDAHEPSTASLLSAFPDSSVKPPANSAAAHHARPGSSSSVNSMPRPHQVLHGDVDTAYASDFSYRAPHDLLHRPSIGRNFTDSPTLEEEQAHEHGGVDPPSLSGAPFVQATSDAKYAPDALVEHEYIDGPHHHGTIVEPEVAVIHSRWVRFDEKFMKPLFGGKKRRIRGPAPQV